MTTSLPSLDGFEVQTDLNLFLRSAVANTPDEIRLPETIVKRDGRVVPFDVGRIENALQRCFDGLERQPFVSVAELAVRAANVLAASTGPISVEKCQDVVELTLQAAGEFEAAKAYILYRHVHAQQRAQRPIPPDVREAFADADGYFPTPIQKFQFFDKYSRFNYGTGRRETWIETVERAVSFLHELVATNTGRDLGGDTYDRIRQGILNMRSMPSMRLLAMAGEAARRDHATTYNCTFLPAESIDAFCEAMLLSMAGCGVGFSVEAQYVENFPRVKRQLGHAPLDYVIEDSAEGWADALRTGMELWFSGGDIVFDYNLIRPAGSPLRTKGGRSSGPEPLRRMLNFVRARMLERQGLHLRTIDAHDIMCMVGNAAVSGGMRRTAMISLFDYDDLDMRLCKSGDFDRENNQRWNANNSAVWPERGLDQMQVVEQVMDMVRSQRGEPGIFNRKAAIDMLPERRKQFGYTDYGCNPCFAPGTLIHTRDGHFPVESLIGKNVDIWNGDGWETVDNFRVTAENQSVLKITLHDGSELRVTPYHKMILEGGRRIEARELEPDMRLAISDAPQTHGPVNEPGAYLKGFLLGDGSSIQGRPMLALYSTKYECADRLAHSAQQLPVEAVHTNALVGTGFGAEDAYQRRGMIGLASRQAALIDWTTTYRERLPERVFAWDQATKLEFIAGLFDADGTTFDTQNGFAYQVCSIHRGMLLDVQALLKTIGVNSKLALMKAAGKKDFGDGYGEYESKDCWRLTIAQAASIRLAQQATFSRLTSFADRTLAYQVKPRFNRVASVVFDGVYDKVFCCTVPSSHSLALTNGTQVGQCGEIILRNWEMCNLSIAVGRADDTLESLKDKVELAAIIGTIQSLATHFPYLRPMWKQNCIEERLLGVDITGQMDCPVTWDADNMRTLRDHAVETNRVWAEKLGINPSASVTCVKPSGNSAQLLNCSSGLHARWSPYYERNARVSANGPIFKVLRDAGVPMDPENGQDRETANTWVVHFPVAAPEGAITRKDRGAIEQCNYWLHNKLNWTTHNPSVTITYRAEEVIDLMKWIWEHKDLIGGMAFLPAYDAQYDQLPYVEISKEEYERRAAAFPEIDFSKLWRYEHADLTVAAQELACAAGVCSIDDVAGA